MQLLVPKQPSAFVFSWLRIKYMSCKGMLYLTRYCLLTSRSFQSVKYQASVSMGRKVEGAIVLKLFFYIAAYEHFIFF